MPGPLATPPIGAPPPPPPPPVSAYRPTGTVDPKYGGDFFGPTGSATTAPTWTDQPEARSTGSPVGRTVKPLVMLAVAALAAVLGFFGYKALFGSDEFIYMGANGEVDAVDAESFFVPVSGYTFGRMPGAAESEIGALMSQMGGVYGAQIDMKVRAVQAKGQFVAAVITVGLPPEQLRSALEAEDPLEMVKQQSNGGEITKVELGGKPAFSFGYGTAHQVLALYENQVLVVTAGTEQDATELAETILDAQP